MNYIKQNKLLLGPFAMPLPEALQYGKLLPYFLSAEEQEQYCLDLKTQPDDWKYRTKEITYQLNADKYRTKEWADINWAESIVVFGCSHVFGEGLSEDETFCYQLEKLIGRPVINLGQSGTSPMFSWHNSLMFEQNFDAPRAVIQLWSEYSRAVYYKRTYTARVGYWSGSRWDNHDAALKQYFELWNDDATNTEVHMHFVAMASRKLWENTSQYVEASYFKSTAGLLGIPYLANLDMARDGIHYGEQTHLNAATIIAQQLGYST